MDFLELLCVGSLFFNPFCCSLLFTSRQQLDTFDDREVVCFFLLVTYLGFTCLFVIHFMHL
jgi:hypothetical protein